MLWLVFLLIWDEQLILTNGSQLTCDRYDTTYDSVIVQQGGWTFVMSRDVVDWERTRALHREEPVETPRETEPVERSPDKPLMIAKLDVRKASIIDLIRFLADMRDINLYIDPSVEDVKVTYRLRNIRWITAMNLVCMNAGLAVELNGNLLSVDAW
ncbi:MAG: hypothetical protein QNK37_19030 [Acidobacteriota bacterium]|nr:hypothetical protein [Acidobacteriota bacterium]